MNNQLRQKRHARIRAKLHGSAARPRVSVYRSSRYIDVQLIDDDKGATLLAVHGKAVKGDNKTSQAEAVGRAAAEQALAAGIKRVVFDRAGYKYHGRLKSVADGLRAGGLEM